MFPPVKTSAISGYVATKHFPKTNGFERQPEHIPMWKRRNINPNHKKIWVKKSPLVFKGVGITSLG